jgi:hypothetical protein
MKLNLKNILSCDLKMHILNLNYNNNISIKYYNNNSLLIC